ncbi:MAG: DUF2510 domain-containing protein [Ilumatobacteraceae bacterium]
MDVGSWQQDPTHRHELRWWDGTRWTDQVADRGANAIDPMPLPGLPTMPLPATAPPSGWTTPTMAAPNTPPPTPVAAAPRPLTGQHSTRVVIAAVAGAAVLGIGGMLLLRDDHTSPSIGQGSTVLTTAGPATTGVAGNATIPATAVAVTTTGAATTVVTTTVATMPANTVASTPATAPPGQATNDVLVAAMPGRDEVPANWVRYSEPVTDLVPESGPGYGFCGGDDAVARALALGSTAFIDGPTWDLETGGWFGVTAYAFPTADAAADYLNTTEQSANGCMTDPVQYDTTETALDLFDESVSDDVVWHVAEGSAGFLETTTDADQLVRTVADSYASVTYGGTDYFVTLSYDNRWERHGRVVLVYWLYGTWGHTGWSEPATWAYQPNDDDLDAAAATIRTTIVQRLAAAGAL